uniref:High mobility group protein B1 n=1 Tax=Leptobrachium leishanense TaxID=445787 RepID=A0A8C5Q8S2_9ANUR
MGKGDPKKPRGKMSSYAYFVQTCREEHKKKHPDASVNFSEFSKKCSERWRTMSAKEKGKFEDMAKTDKVRYEREMKSYIPPKGETKKRFKDPNAPKRPPSAFFLFCSDFRPKIKGEHPGLTIGDVAKKLGEMWNNTASDDKVPYERKAGKLKEKYEKDVAAYRAKGKVEPGKKAPAKPEKSKIKQILRGSQPLDPVMMQLRSRAGNQELKYLELIRVVREEEALLEEKSFRRGERAYAQPVRHNEGLQPESDSLDTYGSDEDEQEHLVVFKSTERAAKESNLPERGELSKTVKKVQETQAELQQAHAELCRVLMKVTEMQAEMQKFLTDMQTTGVAVASGPSPLTKSQQATTSPLSKKRCFGCGEMGHFRAQCKGRRPEKDRVEGLLEALEGLLSTSPAGNARGHK